MNFAKFSSSIYTARTTALLGFSGIAAIIVSFSRLKLAAIDLGPEAIGAIGYLLSISVFATIFFSFGLSLSANTLINRDRSATQKKVILYLTVVGALASIVVSQITFQFSSLLDTLQPFIPEGYLISLVIVLFILAGVAGSISAGKLNGVELSKFRLVGSLIALTLIITSYVSAVGSFQILLYWAAAPIGVIGAIVFLLGKRSARELRALLMPNSGAKPPILRTTVLTSFSLMLTASYVAASHIFLRNQILGETSMMSLSEFQVAWSLSMATFSLLSVSINSTFLAEISRNADDESVLSQVYKKNVIALLLLSVPGYIFLYVYSDQVIMILFTSDFHMAPGMLRTMILGDFIKVFVAPAALIIMVKNKFWYVLLEISSASAFIFLALVLIKGEKQITAIADAYFYSYVLNAIVYFACWRMLLCVPQSRKFK